MAVSSERVSDRYFEVNNCNIQYLSGRDYHMLREKGRADYYVLYIIEGACYIVENGVERAVQAGNIILYRPYERQEYRFSAADSTTTAFVHFSGTAVEDILSAAGFDARVLSLGEAAEPARLFRAAVEEWYMKKPLYKENTVALFLQFFAAAGRQKSYLEKAITPARQRNMDAVLRHMHTHYTENLDVAFYAAMCHRSVGRFAHAFKESTGVSPKHYMLRIKVEAAAELLSTTMLSVAEIARVVGVEDVNYFSRLFKRFTGHTPRTRR
ncbi:MAG: helix-turn-helix transcriptional regulator [Clostridia bacterium]|nr:helix-turn-helix transcriptional regulator [Clostridia bacterium]